MDFRSKKRMLYGGVGGWLMLLSGPCLGQTAAASAAGAADADAIQAGGDIIVTAQKREERILDVPISITAITGDQLSKAGIYESRDLAILTPGLRIDRAAAYTLPALRGVSSQLTSIGSDSNVAMYLDGVYQSSLPAGAFDLPDVQRVEILKGPQGTLFGRNATGGAVQVITLDPKPDFGGKVRVSYGNFDDRIANAFLTGPVTKDVSFSLAGYYRKNDGYNHNLLDGGKHFPGVTSSLIRGKLLFEPTDNLSILATAFHSDLKDGSSIALAPLNGNTVASTIPGAIYGTKPFDVALSYPPIFTIKNTGGSLKIVQETSLGSITSLTGYGRVRTHAQLDGDFAKTLTPGVNYHNYTLETAFSEELNFSSRKFGSVSFLTGLYYFRGSARYKPNRVFSDTYDLEIYSYQPITAKAIFGEVTLGLTDALTVIGGLRYSTEKRTLCGQRVPTGVQPVFNKVDSFKNDSFTPRVSLRYAISDTSNIYFTFSQGFKSGVYNANTPFAPPDRVDPEKLTAYELGTKGRIGPIDFAAAGYYYDYTNIQVQAFGIRNGIVSSIFQNAASGRIYGGELTANLRIDKHLSLATGLSLLHARYASFPAASITIPIGGNVGNVTVAQDASGNDIAKSPPFTLSLTGNYQTEIAGGDLNISSTLYHTAKYYFENGNRVFQPAYTTVDARIGWSPMRTGLTFSIYGRNLTNRTILQSYLASTPGDGVSYASPRTYGVRAELSF